MIGYAHLAAWLLTAGVLAVSAVAKLRSRAAFAAFADSVGRVRLLPARLARPAAATVAAAETTAVALLVVPPLARAGLVLAAVLLAMFTLVVAAAMARGVEAPCRCFGASERPYGPAHLARNVLLLALVAFALLSSPPATYDPAGVAVSAFAALAGTLVVVFLVDFVALFTPGPPAGGQTSAATRRTTA